MVLIGWQVKLDGSVYILENLHIGAKLKRAAAKVKPYCEDGEWLLEPLDRAFIPNPDDEQLPQRTRRHPHRLVEEC